MSRNPDVVLFYVVSGEVLTLAMVGDHSDYSFAGNGSRASSRTASRVWNAVAGGHQPSPEWKSLSWKRPSDLTADPYLAEASASALSAVLAILQQELDEPTLYERLHGHSIYSAPVVDFYSWIEETETARSSVIEALARKPATPEKALEAAMCRQGAGPAV